ncbi:MAG: efflux RND transporter periplasmic adaptor subunit [Myxococcales bacterium]|nr:efflux RND transporter periplasmic adaptor subunit [Myxococcales bacterium]
MARCAARALALALALGGVGACSDRQPPGAGPPPIAVQIVTASARTIPSTVDTVGTLASPEPTVLAAEVPGTVVFVDIAEGRRVERGHVLARIDDAELRARVAENRARFRQAKDRLRRVGSLREQGVASEEALDDALAENDAVQAALEEAETRLQKSQIRAPFEGVLGLRQVSLGQYLEIGDPLVRLTQVDPLELVFAVPQREASRVAVGQTVYGVIGRCEGRFETTVSAIDPRVDVATRMLRLEAKLPNPDGAFAPGMAVRVRLIVDEILGAIVVPQEAIVLQGTKHLVYVVNGDDTAHQHEVTLGEHFTDGVHVTRGIADGDVVVVAGHQKLRPGARIQREAWQDTHNPLLDLGWFGPITDCGL